MEGLAGMDLNALLQGLPSSMGSMAGGEPDTAHLAQLAGAIAAEGRPEPNIDPAERIRIEQLAGQFWRVCLRYGFREEPDVPASLMKNKDMRLLLEAGDASFFLGRVAEMEKLAGVPIWRRALFLWLARQGQGQAVFYGLPADRVVIVGTQAAV